MFQTFPVNSRWSWIWHRATGSLISSSSMIRKSSAASAKSCPLPDINNGLPACPMTVLSLKLFKRCPGLIQIVQSFLPAYRKSSPAGPGLVMDSCDGLQTCSIAAIPCPFQKFCGSLLSLHHLLLIGQGLIQVNIDASSCPYSHWYRASHSAIPTSNMTI